MTKLSSFHNNSSSSNSALQGPHQVAQKFNKYGSFTIDESQGSGDAAAGIKTQIVLDTVGIPSWEEVGFPGDPTKIAADIKNFYEEAAISLADTPPSARRAESWFVTETLGGQTIQTARIKMKEADVNFYFWYYLLPMTQHHEISTN